MPAKAGIKCLAVARLNAETGKALNDTAIVKSFADSALEPVGGSADAFASCAGDKCRTPVSPGYTTTRDTTPLHNNSGLKQRP